MSCRKRKITLEPVTDGTEDQVKKRRGGDKDLQKKAPPLQMTARQKSKLEKEQGKRKREGDLEDAELEIDLTTPPHSTTNTGRSPLKEMDEGQMSLIQRKCKYFQNFSGRHLVYISYI